MQILNQLETEPIPIEEEEQRHTRRLIIGFLCALILTGSVLGGYLYLRKRHEGQVAAAAAAEKIEKEKPRVEVLVDEATIDGKKSVLSGTLHNISNETLRNVAVELQLRRRTGSTVETRVVMPQVTELAADAKTRYSLEVSVQDYSSATFSRVLAGDAHLAIAFKALPGAERPPLPAPASKTIVVSRPAPRSDEFLNTEKNPGRVP
ncbi:MAG TPA: hypothetical protein VGC60_16495 [Pyrinomonadaceae bacterium]|jgi:hypothetical protein